MDSATVASVGWLRSLRTSSGSRDSAPAAGVARALGSVLFVLLALVASIASGCGRASESGKTESGKTESGTATTPNAGTGEAGTGADGVRVVATTGLIADAARRVAGEHARVTALMGEGVDPHMYKASLADVRLLNEADIVLYTGLHLEGRMQDVLGRLGEKKPVLAIAEALPKESLRSPAEFDGQADPHVWFDAALWAGVARPIAEMLAKVDPPRAQVFGENAAAFERELASLHAWARERIATIPPERRVLVTAHDAFGYFGRAYGLEVLGVQGISTDSEASIRDIAALVDTLVSRRVPAVFVESSVSRKTIDALVEGCAARGHNVVVGGELFSDALGPDGTPEGTYVGMFRHNVRTIVQALGGALDESTGNEGTAPVGTSLSAPAEAPVATSPGGSGSGAP
ncbi:MAG: zinc ABC transporter substrate-binding protein [Planctomycetota bacterium]|nr:zinc ABC transporter substrate-binding protein [Planctomycetota bacterium]